MQDITNPTDILYMSKFVRIAEVKDMGVIVVIAGIR